MVYLIGSLRNPQIPSIGKQLRAAGFQVFDDWFSAGCEADDKWKEYEQARGRDYIEALQGEAARHVFEFDKRHLESADIAVLVMPAGKSAFLELGWHLRSGKPGYILIEHDKDRWDVMALFATGVAKNIDGLLTMMHREQMKQNPPEPGSMVFYAR